MKDALEIVKEGIWFTESLPSDLAFEKLDGILGELYERIAHAEAQLRIRAHQVAPPTLFEGHIEGLEEGLASLTVGTEGVNPPHSFTIRDAERLIRAGMNLVDPDNKDLVVSVGNWPLATVEVNWDYRDGKARLLWLVHLSNVKWPAVRVNTYIRERPDHPRLLARTHHSAFGILKQFEGFLTSIQCRKTT